MSTYADKTQENESRLTASALSRKEKGEGLQFTDNRPGSIAQRKLKAMLENGSKTKQAVQLQKATNNSTVQDPAPVQKKENNTGLPDNLKSGIENLSGHGMDDVKVHYNSGKPSQLQAHAYAQGTDIHIAPGQEKHLPHEAWHVVQQKQGRVKPTMQMKGKVNVNDDEGLEHEADVMGAKAIQQKAFGAPAPKTIGSNNPVVQRAAWIGDNPKQWDVLIDGVQWFSDAEDNLWYTAEGLAPGSTFLKYAGESNKRTYEQWDTAEFQLNTQLTEPIGDDESKKKLFIDDKGEGPTVIHSASDLLVWLVSHPEGPENTPKHFAEPKKMLSVLKLLSDEDKAYTGAEVWDAVRTVVPLVEVRQEDSSSEEEEEDSDDDGIGFFAPPKVKKKEASSSEEDSDDDGIGFFAPPKVKKDDEKDDTDSDWGSGEDEVNEDEESQWPEGTWAKDKDGFIVPADFKRIMPKKEKKRLQAEQAESLKGYKLVGFHATGIENVGSLVTHGVSAGRMGTGHKLGKGPGFYVVPLLAGINISVAKKDAKMWGHLVAVYVPKGVPTEKEKKPEDLGFDFGEEEEKEFKPATGKSMASSASASYESDEEEKEFKPAAGKPGALSASESEDEEEDEEVVEPMILYGNDELVIPVSLFSKIRLVRNVDDIAMTSRPDYRTEPVDDPVSDFSKSK